MECESTTPGQGEVRREIRPRPDGPFLPVPPAADVDLQLALVFHGRWVSTKNIRIGRKPIPAKGRAATRERRRQGEGVVRGKRTPVLRRGASVMTAVAVILIVVFFMTESIVVRDTIHTLIPLPVGDRDPHQHTATSLASGHALALAVRSIALLRCR